MSLTPEDVTNKQFTRLRRGGFDEAEVEQFKGQVVEELEAHQRQLANARAEIIRLMDELQATEARPVNAPDSDTVGRWVAELITNSETAAATAIADARAEADLIRRDADDYAQRTRGEVDALRGRTESEVDTYRRETVSHAETVRAEAQENLAQMQRDAEDAIRSTHRAVAEELEERSAAVRSTERDLLARLVSTAEDVSAALKHFKAVTGVGIESADGGVADIDLTTPPPPPLPHRLRPVADEARPSQARRSLDTDPADSWGVDTGPGGPGA